MINYFLIKSKCARFFDECQSSFYQTTPCGTKFEIIDELDTREETLNAIFVINKNKNLVCF